MRWIIALVMILLLPTAMAIQSGEGIVDKKGMEKSRKDEHQPPAPRNETKKTRTEIREEIRSEIKIQEKNREIAKEKKEKLEKSLQQRFKDYQEYRDLYQKSGLQSEKGFKYAKLYVAHGVYAILDFLNLIKADIEALNLPNETKEEVSQKIDDIIQTLEAKIEKINQSNTTEEFRSAVKDLNSYWKSVRKEVRIYSELVVVAKLDDLIDTAEMIGLDLNESQEVDSQLLSEYFEHLERARDLLNTAAEKISKGDDAMDEIQMVRKEIQRAFDILREIYRETKPFFGNETGQLWVEINGTATVNGNAVIHIRGNATVEVTPSHAVITAVGFKKSDGVFSGDGNLVIKGNVTVNASGNFRMFVKGSAVIYVEGVGEYKVKPLPEDEMGEFTIQNNETIVIGE